MLPRIASSQLSAVEEFADLPEAPIDTNKSVEQQSFLPAIVSNKVWNSVSARNHIEMILPLISSEIKESKSVVAQEILTRISINNQLLYFELTAIRIQSVVRRYLSTIRVQQIRRRIALFKNITEHIAARYVEEIVLATSFEISLEFYRQHMRFKRLQESVESELIFVASDILNELLEQLTLEVTNETITDVINVVLALRGRSQEVLEAELKAREAASAVADPIAAKSSNPLLSLLETITDEAVAQSIRSVVCESVNEEVQEYLAAENCDRIYKSLLQDMLLDALVDVIQIYFGDQPDTVQPMVDEIYNMQYTLFSGNPASPSRPGLHRRFSTYNALK